jgi:hypothetical protein
MFYARERDTFTESVMQINVHQFLSTSKSSSFLFFENIFFLVKRTGKLNPIQSVQTNVAYPLQCNLLPEPRLLIPAVPYSPYFPLTKSAFI